MDSIKTGRLIADLRKEKGMTQKALADIINISDRTISKWECGRGCPDISLLGQLSAVLGVNIEKILSGELEPDDRDGGNMKKIKFYVCPDCNSISCCTGNSELSCCGKKLSPLILHQMDLQHKISVEEVETDLYITMQHDMEKQHYITFAAYASYDRVLLLKLYPEQAAEIRFPKMHGGTLYICCSRHGLFQC